ncbi:hypothetical protein DPEC_G00364810 [Dallia pectoralis]|nr:hypothetical protein DPEC_G00364810 [Dallia pectoralis]
MSSPSVLRLALVMGVVVDTLSADHAVCVTSWHDPAIVKARAHCSQAVRPSDIQVEQIFRTCSCLYPLVSDRIRNHDHRSPIWGPGWLFVLMFRNLCPLHMLHFNPGSKEPTTLPSGVLSEADGMPRMSVIPNWTMQVACIAPPESHTPQPPEPRSRRDHKSENRIVETIREELHPHNLIG